MVDPPATPVEAPMQAPVEAPAEVPTEPAPAAAHHRNKLTVPRYAPALSTAPGPPQRQHRCYLSPSIGFRESFNTTW